MGGGAAADAGAPPSRAAAPMVAIWLRSPHSARKVRVKDSSRMGDTTRRSVEASGPSAPTLASPPSLGDLGEDCGGGRGRGEGRALRAGCGREAEGRGQRAQRAARPVSCRRSASATTGLQERRHVTSRGTPPPQTQTSTTSDPTRRQVGRVSGSEFSSTSSGTSSGTGLHLVHLQLLLHLIQLVLPSVRIGQRLIQHAAAEEEEEGGGAVVGPRLADLEDGRGGRAAGQSVGEAQRWL